MAVIETKDGDVIHRGQLLGLTGLDYPAGSIENVDVSVTAAIAASKLQRGPVIPVHQSGTAADETIIAFFCKGTAGTVKNFTVSNLTANAGSSTVTVDLKKNGVTMLSSVVTLNSGKAAFSETEGTLSVTTLADGDYLTVVIDAIASGTDALATGVFAQIELDEDYVA